MVKATLVITDEAISVSMTEADVVTLAVTQGTSLWEADGADHIKPKGGKTVDAQYLELGGKVDKVTGKELSDNNYTDAEVTKVGYIDGTGDGESVLTDDGTYKRNMPTVASNVTFTPAGNIAATNVQSAIEELDTEFFRSADNMPFTDTYTYYTTDEVGDALVQLGRDIVYKDNNIKPIYIETADKTNQPLHPSVVYIAAGFNGYKYWMVESPLPNDVLPYNSRYECPNIHCSNDGLHWIIPEGLTNPIDDLTAPEIANGDFFSDPHLLFKNNTLECWYRITHIDNTTYPGFTAPTWLIRKTSSDGVTWSAREVMNNYQDPASGLYDMARSPAIMWDGSKYKMWFVDKLAPITPRNVVYAESTDGLIWTGRTNCTLNGLTDDNWHIDVSYSNSKYHLIVYGETNQNLNYYTSTNGTTFTFVKEMLRKSPLIGTNFSTGLYRSSLIWNGTNYIAYITAQSSTKYSLMVAVGTTVENLKLVDGTYFREKQEFENGIEIVNNGVMSSEIKMTDKGTSIGIDYDTEKVYIKLANGTKVYLN